MDKGPSLFVDPVKGDDSHAGTEQQPWKTVRHALSHLRPGDTLYLRGGTYYEAVTVAASGAEGKPIPVGFLTVEPQGERFERGG